MQRLSLRKMLIVSLLKILVVSGGSSGDDESGGSKKTTAAPTTTAAPAPTKTSSPDTFKPLEEIITKDMFDEMFQNALVSADCDAQTKNETGKLSYTNFLLAAKNFPDFASVGDEFTRINEVAAFFGQVSQETGGYWDGAWDPKWSWGLCHNKEQGDCTPDKCGYDHSEKDCYCGRGPIQLTWKSNYESFNDDMKDMGLFPNENFVENPERLVEDAVIGFTSAFWFWFKIQEPKPSIHSVMVSLNRGKDAYLSLNKVEKDKVDAEYDLYKPYEKIDDNKICDYAFGLATNIINGGIECNVSSEPKENSVRRKNYYKYFLDIMKPSDDEFYSYTNYNKSDDGVDGALCNYMKDFA